MSEANLKCFNKILLHEEFDRTCPSEKDKRDKKEKNKANVEIQISIGFPKEEKTDFILKKGRFNIKIIVNIEDTKKEDRKISYLGTYSIEYQVEGEVGITEEDITKRSLIDKQIIQEIIKRVEETVSLSGIRNLTLTNEL